MRLLFATPRFPGAGARGDQMRAWQQLRHLAPRHAITLLCPEPPDRARAACREVLELCDEVRVVPAGRFAPWLHAAAALPGTRPLQVALYDGWPGRAAVRALRLDRFDLAQVQMVRLAGLFEALAPLPRVLDAVDALSLNMRRRALLDRGPRRWLAALEARRLATLEARLLAQAAGVAVSARADRDAMAAPQAMLVPNGVDPDEFPYVPGRHGARIVFGANLGYFPNVDAALWFAHEVLPRVRRAVPEAQFDLVGARPAAVLRRLARRQPGVVLVGPVPRMHPWLARAAVAVAPLRAGSGQQLKLLEAMASGTPLVASPASAAGVEADAGTHLLVGTDAASMADAVLHLLRDPHAAQAMAAAAHARVLERYTWARAAQGLEALWQHALGAR